MKSRGFTTLFLTTLLSGTICLVPNTAWARRGGSSYSGGSRSSSHSTGSYGRSVQVRSYTRHDGTHVNSYTRSSPGSSSRYSGSSGYSTDSEYSDDSEYSGSSNDSNPNFTTSDTFQDALDSAISATTIAQSAVSEDDWKLVSSKLQNAINLLKAVPATNTNYVEAQIKIQEYGANLNYAQQQLGLPPLIQLQSEEVATQTTLNDEPQQSEETSLVVAPDISPTVSSQDLTVTAPVSPPPEVTPTASTASPEVAPDSESNPLGGIILTLLIALVAIAIYRAKTTKHSDTKSAPETKNVPVTQTVPIYSKPNYYLPKNYSVPNFERKAGILERTGSIALGLGALVAFGLLNQKMGGGVGSGSVRVSGYRRSNGTFVHSHTRHRPR